jgi:hypothetical protein
MPEIGKRIEYVPLEQLRFDPDNPRLPGSVDGSQPSQVLAWMLKDATLVELMNAIGQVGYFPGEPLLLAPANEPNTYTVVEGNRRLAALLLLNDPALAPTRKQAVRTAVDEARYRPAEAPVVIYDAREDILDYLGYRHITGIKAWDPLEKARYLSQLYATTDGGSPAERYRALARTIGTRADYVARLLTGLRVYEEIEARAFYGIPSLQQGEIDFSILTTALNYASLAEFIGLQGRGDAEAENLNQAALEQLTNWLFAENAEGRTRLGESRNLKLLSRVVEHREALERFRDGLPLADAYRLTEAPTEIFRTSIFEARNRLRSAWDYADRLTDVTESDGATADEVFNLSRNLRAVVRTALDESGGA